MKNRLGGLARRATYIEQLKKEGGPFVHLDAGDAFNKAYSVTDKDRPGIVSAAGVYLDVFKIMGLHAYTVGDRDLSLGIPLLKTLAKKASFPFLSANLVDKESGKPVFDGHTIVKAAGYKIGVIGATTMVFVNRVEFQTKEGVEVKEPEDAVKREIAAAKAKGAQMFVLLGHLNQSEVERTVKANPEISVVLGGQWVNMDRRVKKMEGAFVAGAYMRGKNVSVMDLHVKNGSLGFVDRDIRGGLERQKAQLEARIKSRQRSIEQAEKNPARKSSLEYLQRNLVQLKTELQEVTMDLEDAGEPDQNSSYIKWELKGMDTGFKDHEKVAALVAKHREVYPDPTKKKPTPRVPQPALKKPGAATPRIPTRRPTPPTTGKAIDRRNMTIIGGAAPEKPAAKPKTKPKSR